MLKKALFPITQLSLDTYNLFIQLDSVRGHFNIFDYEQKVCKEYASVISESLKNYDLPIKVAITNKTSLTTAINQYKKILQLISSVDKGLQNNLNFTKLEIETPKNAIGEQGFDKWITSLISTIKSLPKSKMVYGNKSYSTVGNVLFCKTSTFSLPSNMVHDIDTWCKRSISDNNYGSYSSTKSMDFISNLISSSNPHDCDAVIEEAYNLANGYVKTHPEAMISVDDIITLFLESYKNSLGQVYAVEEQKQAKKRASFWTGFVIWAIIMGALAIFLFVFKPLIPLPEFKENGFFANVGLTILCIIGFALIQSVIACLGFCNEVTGETPFFICYKAPVFPRGAFLMICCYMVFASDYSSLVVDYITPFNIFGIVCIIASLCYEFLDAISPKAEFYIIAKWKSMFRGQVMFTTPLAIVPTIIFFAFVCTFTFLHIVAVWVLLIFNIIFMLIAVICTIFGLD